MLSVFMDSVKNSQVCFWRTLRASKQHWRYEKKYGTTGYKMGASVKKTVTWRWNQSVLLVDDLLSLLQQDFLRLIQSELQGVEFARVLFHCADVIPQLSAALLAAHSRRQARTGKIRRTIPVETFTVFWVALQGFGRKDRLQHFQVLSENKSTCPISSCGMQLKNVLLCNILAQNNVTKDKK